MIFFFKIKPIFLIMENCTLILYKTNGQHAVLSVYTHLIHGHLIQELSWPSGLSTSLYRPRTSILEVPHEFKSRRGSSILWQGALSSFAKSFGGDFKPSVPCIGESHPMHVKEPTSLLAKSREKSRWSGQPVKHTETGVWCRPLVVHPRRLHNSV